MARKPTKLKQVLFVYVEPVNKKWLTKVVKEMKPTGGVSGFVNALISDFRTQPVVKGK